jgi:hypothetical protein
MILSKKINRLGCINRDFSSKDNPDGIILLNTVFSKIKENNDLGIGITCFEIPQGYTFPELDFIEDDSPSNVLVWEMFRFIKSTNHRIFFFLPTHYFLGSQIPEVVENTKSLIIGISLLLDQIGIDYPSILLRVGSAYGARKTTMERFCENVKSLDHKVIKKIAVCNDEKPSLFSVTDLLSGVYYSCNLPIAFRLLPHQFNNGGLSIREALLLAVSTWQEGTTPVFIHSESSEIDENGVSLSPSPSNYLGHRIPTFGLDIDTILDSPAESKCCLKYRSELISLKPMVINKIDRK